MTGARAFGALAATALLVLAGCGEKTQAVGEAPAPEVVGQTGQGTNLQRFEVRLQGRLMTVQIFNRGGGARVAAVSARSYRGLDRADGQMALNAAARAGQNIDCGNGQPLRVLPESGTFQEAGRRSAFTTGEAAWVFQARCG